MKHGNATLGSLIALVSAMSFALNLVLAGKSYEYGANIHALNMARASLFLGCLLVVVYLRPRPVTLGARDHLVCILIGVLLCTEMYVLLGAIRDIPVAVATLIFFTYPALIAVAGWFMGTDRFSAPLLGLMGLTLIGLTIVLVDSPVAFAFEGVAMAVLASVVMAAMLITSERALNVHDNHLVLLNALAVVTTIILVMSLTVVDLEYPVGRAGWLYYAGSTVFYVVATFCLFTAVSMVGPLRTAIIDTTSPVWTLVFGMFLLSQSLAPRQLAGAALVLASVVALHVLKSRMDRERILAARRLGQPDAAPETPME